MTKARKATAAAKKAEPALMSAGSANFFLDKLEHDIARLKAAEKKPGSIESQYTHFDACCTLMVAHEWLHVELQTLGVDLDALYPRKNLMYFQPFEAVAKEESLGKPQFVAAIATYASGHAPSTSYSMWPAVRQEKKGTGKASTELAKHYDKLRKIHAKYFA